MNYDRITRNLQASQIRHEMYEGRDHLVVPTVMIAEGVWNGSQGPLLYLRDKLEESDFAWNYRPAVLDHPTINGEGVSACRPDVLEHYKLGSIFHAKQDAEKLKNETWLDVEKLNKIAPGILQSLNEGKPVEVSTGLYHDADMTPGEWNGKKYVGIVRNIRPDHLAILPDTRGAMSVADGAGLLQNASHDLSHNDVKDHLHQHLNQSKDEYDSPLGYKDRAHIQDVYPNHVVYDKGGKSYKHQYKVKNGKASLHGEPEEVHRVTSYVCSNGQTIMNARGLYVTNTGHLANEEHQGPVKAPVVPETPKLIKPNIGELDDIHKKNQFQKTLELKYSGVQQEGDWGGWVTDLYANYVVWSKDGKLFRLPYTYDDDKIRFDGEEEEVERVSEYRRKTPIDGTQSPYSVNKGSKMASQAQKDTILRLAAAIQQNQITDNMIHQGAHHLLHDATGHADAHHGSGGASDGQLRTSADGAREQEVDRLIGGGHMKEEMRGFLMDLPDDHFKKIQLPAVQGATQPIVPYGYAGIGDRSSVHHAPAPAAHNQAMDINTYIALAPPQLKAGLARMVANEEQRRQHLVQLITNSPYYKDVNPKWLEAQEINQLELIARPLMQQPQPHPQPVPNYSGQGDIPMFLTGNQAGGQTTNASGDTPPLQLRGVFSEIEERKAS